MSRSRPANSTAERMAKLRQADAGVINLTPFRGPSCASAAAFEAGVLAGLGRPVMAYVNVSDESEAEYVDRVEVHVGAQRDETASGATATAAWSRISACPRP
jgi:nucleoside 2-deoxyribosyltransferase